MPFNIRNLIIFLAIGVAISSAYYFFMRPAEPAGNLTSSSTTTIPEGVGSGNVAMQNELAQNFLSLLLNVKNIRIENDIFKDQSFNSLIDSSIVLNPDTDPGRPNPFAQFGADAVETTPSSTSSSSAPVNSPSSTTPVTPTTGM